MRQQYRETRHHHQRDHPPDHWNQLGCHIEFHRCYLLRTPPRKRDAKHTSHKTSRSTHFSAAWMVQRRKLSVAVRQRSLDFMKRQHCQILLAAAKT